MKININEFDGCFGIELVPESIADVSLLIRMKINMAAKPMTLSVDAQRDGVVSGWAVLKKLRTTRSNIK